MAHIIIPTEVCNEIVPITCQSKLYPKSFYCHYNRCYNLCTIVYEWNTSHIRLCAFHSTIIESPRRVYNCLILAALDDLLPELRELIIMFICAINN